MSSTSSVQVLVDDTSPRISYSTIGNPWHTSGSFEVEYNSTTHGTKAQRTASFSFSFNGTSVGVFTTVPHFEFQTSVAPNVACEVDGTSIPSFPPEFNSGEAQYHYLSCQSPSLAGPAEHMLTVNIETFDTQYWLDYIIYANNLEQDVLIGPDNAKVHIMEDDSDARIEFHPPEAWSRRDGLPQHANTSRSTNTGGATATYRFMGTGIEVYGTLEVEDSTLFPFTAAFSIDGESAGRYRSPDLVERAMYRMPLFTSGGLSEAEHTLVVTYQSDGARMMYLDYFVHTITPSLLLFSPSPSVPSASTPSCIESSSTTPAQATDGGTVSRDPRSGAEKQQPNVAVIAGATIGAAALVIVLIIASVLLCRRKQRGAAQALHDSEHRVDVYSKQVIPTDNARSGGGDRPARFRKEGAVVSHATSHPQRRQHVDGGVQLASASNNGSHLEDDFPPVYQPTYN